MVSVMKRLMELLGDGRSRTLYALAQELGTTEEDIKRQLEFLEHIGSVKKVSFAAKGCKGCTGCEGSAASCKGCIPENAAVNMGDMWEVVKRQ